MSEDRGQQLVDRLSEMLGEHCVGYVVALEFEDDGEGRTYYCYGGGLTLALGLAERTRGWMGDQAAKVDQADEEDDEEP